MSIRRETKNNAAFGIFAAVLFNQAGGDEIIQNRSRQFDRIKLEALRCRDVINYATRADFAMQQAFI